MKVQYRDFGGDLQEATGEQFDELYKAGKIPPEQTVLANEKKYKVPELIDIIEDAKDEALLKAAKKAKLEEEQFQKAAPWWLKRKARWIINLTACGLLPVCYGLCNFVLWKGFLCVFIPYSVYLLAGGKRYNPYYDIIYCDEHEDIIRQVKERRDRRRKNDDNQNGGKDHG